MKTGIVSTGGRLKQIVLSKIGSLRCGGRHGHSYALISFIDRKTRHERMFLQCSVCGAETEGFRLGMTPRKKPQ